MIWGGEFGVRGDSFCGLSKGGGHEVQVGAIVEITSAVGRSDCPKWELRCLFGFRSIFPKTASSLIPRMLYSSRDDCTMSLFTYLRAPYANSSSITDSQGIYWCGLLKKQASIS